MEEHIFDEELADKIQYHAKLATGKCIICQCEVSGRKMYCDSCYKEHKKQLSNKNYYNFKKNKNQKFVDFMEEARELLKDIDLTQYGVKKRGSER